jgi:hypothetical protein
MPFFLIHSPFNSSVAPSKPIKYPSRNNHFNSSILYNKVNYFPSLANITSTANFPYSKKGEVPLFIQRLIKPLPSTLIRCCCEGYLPKSTTSPQPQAQNYRGSYQRTLGIYEQSLKLIE